MSAALKRILIVDDDKNFSRLVQMAFQANGFEAFAAQSGEEGLKIFQEQRPPIVVLDLAMPGLNGFQVTEKIRQMEPEGTHTTVVIMTAHARNFFVSKELESDIDSYLTKPILPDDIVAQVFALTDQTESH